MTDKHLNWLEERRKGIGGSDAPAVLGISPWKTPYQVYMEKTTPPGPQEDNDRMFWGRTLEPVVRQRYADVTGREVVVPQKILVSPDHPFMLANVDGISGGDRILEVKTTGSVRGWGEPGTDEIPEIYLVQVQHYLTVTKMELADVAVLIGGNDFRIYHVPADVELQKILVDKEAEFWGMVERGFPPDPITYADAKLRFGTASEARKVQASPEAIEAWEILQAIKIVEKKKESAQATIMNLLEDADTLVDGENILCTWKEAKPSRRFDTTAFKAAYPDLHEEFLKEGNPSRRFLLKTPKGE